MYLQNAMQSGPQNSMLNMTQRLPAPYELNSPTAPMSGAPQSLARGGRTSKHRMIKVHMNPHELQILDHLQGRTDYSPQGIKRYSHLEELLRNPHIVKSVHHHARQHHAHGGLTPAMQHLRAGGRFGDSQLAEIGPHTHGLFNELAGYPTRNPHTGHPEYFSLGGALGGLWNTVKGVAAPVLGMAKGIASPILNTVSGLFGGGSKGGASGGAAPDYMAMAQQALGGGSGAPNPYLSAIGQGINAYRGGAKPSEIFGQGLSSIGSQMGGGFGNALSESGQSLAQGRGFGESMRRGAQRGYNDLGGDQGLYDAVGNVGQGLMQGGFGGARQAASHQLSQYAQRAMPRPANQRQEQYEESPYDQYQEEPSQMYGY